MKPVSNISALPLVVPSYTQILISHDPEHLALWYYLNPKPHPCSTPTLVTEIRDLQTRVVDYLNTSQDARDSLRYLVTASATPEVFSLGDDLELFVRLVEERDRDTLFGYGRSCIDVVYHNWINLGIPTLTTISLVQGIALGGGFVGALSSNVLIANEYAQMGFPGIMFNLFSTMVGYSLLTRRIEPVRAERLIQSDRQHKGQELKEMGVVDELAANGEEIHAVNHYIRCRQRSTNGHLAIQQVRQRVNPLIHQELLDVVEIWVDAAMDMTVQDLHSMTQIIQARSEPDIPENNTSAKPQRRYGNVQALEER